MSSLIKLHQTCNGCGLTREFLLSIRDLTPDILRSYFRRGAWRDVGGNNDLCGCCIKRALHQPVADDSGPPHTSTCRCKESGT